ncbi:hypothetical protein ABK040_014937 [Willaertia magna]
MSLNQTNNNTPKRKVFISGLGGGLDIHNAFLLYSLFKEYINKEEEGDTLKYFNDVFLGSVRPCPQSNIINPVNSSLHTHLTILNGDSSINSKGRYYEPTIAKELKENVYLLSTDTSDYNQIRSETAIYVDGGGDSLITTKEDCIDQIHSDPFLGGDALLLAAIHHLANTGLVNHVNFFQAVIAVGLDVNVKGVNSNLKELNENYFGKINFSTGKIRDTKIENETIKSLLFQLFSNENIRTQALEKYFTVSEKYLVLTEEHFKQYEKEKKQNISPPSRFPSHTATVTYHSLKNNFGIQRTFVPWEPKLTGKQKGVMVNNKHQWMYLVNPVALENLKIKKNPTIQGNNNDSKE